MALIKRIARLFRADFHAVLDRVEEPEALLQQSLREMDEALSADERHHQMLQHDYEELNQRETDLQQALTSLGEELDLCFAADKEALARPLVRRQLETERLLQQLTLKRRRIEKESEGLQQRIDQHRAQLESMRQKAEVFTRAGAPGRPAQTWPEGAEPVRDEDVEVALLRERQRRATS